MASIFNENVSNLSPTVKQSLEVALGRPLESHQRVFIQVFDPNAVPDEASRRAALAGLQGTFAQTDQFAKEHCVTAEEVDAAVEEAVAHVRRRPA